jgi:hypothetical protein
MVRVIAIWGIVAIVAAIVGGIVAARKNRDASAWAAWGFLFPPAVLALVLLPKLPTRLPRRSLDEEDAAQARADGY